MRDRFVRVLVDEMAQDPNIVLLIGDLGFGVMKPVWERFPDRIINAGIAEQSMVGLAAGLAATGKTVLVYSIGNFPTLRPLEQIRNDCAYHGANVKIVCVGGGFVYGSLGMSHHATEDMAVMRAAERLAGINIWAEVVSFPCIKPMDTEAVRDLAKRFRHLVTVEEHNIVGGFGSAVCEIVAETGSGCRVHRIGLQDTYTTVVGNQQYLREVYGMDEKSIAEKAEAWLHEA